jgi:hypothetical protein
VQTRPLSQSAACFPYDAPTAGSRPSASPEPCLMRVPRIIGLPSMTAGSISMRSMVILRRLAEGATEADFPDAYPRLERADILAALAYAAETVAHETVLLPKAG